MIKTIIFDLGEVYLKGFLGMEHYLEDLFLIPAKEILNKIKNEDFMYLIEGKISEEEYWKRVIRKNSLEIDINLLKQAVRKNFSEIKGTRKIIEKLKLKGYKLGLLSLHAKEWIEYCEEKFSFHKLFDSVLYSFEIDTCSFDETFYKEMLKKLNSKPNECIIIDDEESNLLPAKKLGIKTILFKNPKQLKEQLESLRLL
jgi:putative hydrolase of the HAD superfamily